MPRSVDRVFEIYELVEQILLLLPMRRLFVDQRVCRTWQHIIARSQELQKKMFLLPISSAIKPDNGTVRQTIQLNPAMQFECPGWRRQYDSSGKNTRTMALLHIDTSDRVCEFKIAPMVATRYKTPENLQWRSQKDKHAFKRPYASWREMLISQPPLAAMYYGPDEYAEACELSPVTIYNPEGLTLGWLEEWADWLTWVANYHDESFSRMWRSVGSFTFGFEEEDKLEEGALKRAVEQCHGGRDLVLCRCSFELKQEE